MPGGTAVAHRRRTASRATRAAAVDRARVRPGRLGTPCLCRPGRRARHDPRVQVEERAVEARLTVPAPALDRSGPCRRRPRLDRDGRHPRRRGRQRRPRPGHTGAARGLPPSPDPAGRSGCPACCSPSPAPCCCAAPRGTPSPGSSRESACSGPSTAWSTSWLTYAVQSDPPLAGRLGRVLVRVAPRSLAAARPAIAAAALPRRSAAHRPVAHGVDRQPRLHRRPAGPAARRTLGHRRPPVGRTPSRPSTGHSTSTRRACRCPKGVLLPLLQVAFPLVALGVLVPLAVVAHRLRQASGESRRRMRWLLWAGVVDALVMLGALVFPTSTVSYDLALAVGLTGLAVTLGILRPRAVDIDRLLGGDPRLRRARRRRRRSRPGRAGRRGRAARRRLRRARTRPC